MDHEQFRDVGRAAFRGPTSWMLSLGIAFVIVSQLPMMIAWYPKSSVWFTTLGLSTILLLIPMQWMRSRVVSSRSFQALLIHERIVLALACLVVAGICITGWVEEKPGIWFDNLWKLSSTNWESLRQLKQLANTLVLASLTFALSIALCSGPEPSSSTPRRPFPVGLAIIGSLLFLMISNSAVVWYVTAEQTAYAFDKSTYWMMSANLGESLKHNPTVAIAEIVRSIRSADYTLIPALPSALVQAIISDHRLVYILSIVNIHALSVGLAASLFVRHFLPKNAPQWVAFAPMLVLLTTPWLWYPIVSGYYDIGGVTIAIVIAILYFKYPLYEQSAKRMLAMGALLALLILFRRWYAYWGVWFGLFMAMENGIYWLYHGPYNRRLIWSCIRLPFVVALTAAIIMILVAWPTVQRVLTTNYADTYSAYHLERPFWTSALSLIDHDGRIWWLTMAASMLFLISHTQTRRMALFLGLMVPIIYLHFFQTQDVALHHTYIFAPAMLLLSGVALARLLALVGAIHRAIIIAGVIMIGGLGHWTAFVDRNGSSFGEPWLPTANEFPHRRDDLTELFRLLDSLESETDEGKTFVVLASSPTLSPSMIDTAGRTFRRTSLADRQPLVAEVDRRDGFPNALLQADYVVVADPPQTHLRPAEQQVIVQPALSFIHGTDIAQAFEPLPLTFQLENGVSVRIYKRQRANRASEIRQLADRLRAVHPDRPNIYTPVVPAKSK